MKEKRIGEAVFDGNNVEELVEVLKPMTDQSVYAAICVSHIRRLKSSTEKKDTHMVSFTWDGNQLDLEEGDTVILKLDPETEKVSVAKLSAD